MLMEERIIGSYTEGSLLVNLDENKKGWERRFKEADLQTEKYSSKKIDLEKNKEVVKKHIENWRKDTELSTYVSPAIYSIELYTLNNIESTAEYKKEMKAIKEKLLTSYVDSAFTKYHYLWVTFNASGMVVTVGRSSFTERTTQLGDLFFEYNLFGNGSQKIILHNLSEVDQDIKKYLHELGKKLNDYNHFAFIVPIKSGEVKIVSELEKRLGDYLIEQDIEIMNFYSHRY